MRSATPCRHARRFIHLCEEAERGSLESTQQAHEQFVRELALVQLQVGGRARTLLRQRHGPLACMHHL